MTAEFTQLEISALHDALDRLPADPTAVYAPVVATVRALAAGGWLRIPPITPPDPAPGGVTPPATAAAFALANLLGGTPELTTHRLGYEIGADGEVRISTQHSAAPAGAISALAAALGGEVSSYDNPGRRADGTTRPFRCHSLSAELAGRSVYCTTYEYPESKPDPSPDGADAAADGLAVTG